jgi:hypothetical protein
LARHKGIELDANTIKQIRKLTDKQFSIIWNNGDSLVRCDGDSSFSHYAQAALLASQNGHPLSPVLSDILKRMGDLRKEVHPHTGMPLLYNYTSESHRKDATQASSAGRAVTSHLALYDYAPQDQRPRRAQELLEAANNFEHHFSQLFEVADFNRTHDRNPRGEGMATYYGFGNVTYAAQALVKLKADRSLTQAQQKEVAWLSERISNRLLNLMRTEDNFTDDSRYNILAAIALKKLNLAFGNLP